MMLHLSIEMGLVLYIGDALMKKQPQSGQHTHTQRNRYVLSPKPKPKMLAALKSSPDDARKYLAEQRYQAAS